MDTGQFLTYLFIYALPHIIATLAHQAAHKDKALRKAFLRRQAWLPQGHHRITLRKKVKRYKKLISVSEGEDNNRMQAYLFPLAMASFKVGCRVESLACWLCRRSHVPPLHLTALQGLNGPSKPPSLLFASDLFPLGLDNHASRCMANAPHLFEELRLTPESRKVDGIGEGLDIAGTGTLVLRIQDDNGKVHTIKIPKSLYLPGLRQCLLLPQHWAQETKAMGNKGKTWMTNYWDKCVLCWGGASFARPFLITPPPTHQFSIARLPPRAIEPS